MLRLLATETVFVYGWRDVVLAVVVAALILGLGGFIAWVYISVAFDKVRAWFKKERTWR